MLADFYSWFRPVLFQFDAEEAHHWTLSALRWAEKCGAARLLAPRVTAPSVGAMGLEFPNVVGMAAGLDKGGVCIDGFGALGFGHIEVGTITPRPQSGNSKPRVFRLVEHEAILNRLGFNNPGLDQALRNIQGRKWRGVLGFNIGKNFDTPNERAAEDYLTCLRGAYAHVDYITVNISSPNTIGLRDLQEEDAVRRLLRALKSEQDRLSQHYRKYTPLAIKIAPDLDAEQVKALSAIFLREKIDGVVATNTTIARSGVANHRWVSEVGGLSGAPLREMANTAIRTLRGEIGTQIPIIGVGGIMNGGDAQEKLAAGATLVQVYTGLIYRGPALVAEILRGGTGCPQASPCNEAFSVLFNESDRPISSRRSHS
ncbi:MAG: quinone-dependent dihydroorotate dehydrogenase [Verrucomicrobiales bacterium]